MARKILLADDSVTAQNMGRKILADAGYEVITVNNGSAALKKIAEHKPDLIVLDVYMPGYSGLEVCQRLKETQETSRVPVLLTVGKLEPFKPEEARRARADAFIVKPFEASELLSALSKLEDKIVPRSEASKPGRFARATAALDEGRYDKAVAVDEDSGWKSRIAFPSKKKAKAVEEDGDDPAIYNAVNKDLRTVVEHKLAEETQETKKPDEGRVDLGALAPEGLPKDVTPEEIAALAAAAAQVKGKMAESKPAAAESKVEDKPAESPAAEERIPEVTTIAPATFAEQKSEEKIDAPAENTSAASPEAPSIATPSPADVMAAISGLEIESATPVSSEPTNGAWAQSPADKAADEPVTMAMAAGATSGGSAARWTAVAVALAPEEAGMSLEHEMQKAYAAFAAAEAGHAGVAHTNPEKQSESFESAAASEPSLPSSSTLVEPVASIPAAPAPEDVQALSAVSTAATDAISAAVQELETVAALFVPEKPAALPEPKPEPVAEVPAEPAPEAPAIVEAKAEENSPAVAAAREPEPAKLETTTQPNDSESTQQEKKTEESKTDAESAPLAVAAATEEPPLRNVETVEAAESPVNEEIAEQTSASEVSPKEASPAPQERVAAGAGDMAKKESDIAATTAAAWASWRRIRESGDAKDEHPADFAQADEDASTPSDLAARAVAAGAEKTPDEASGDSDPAAIASIVDSVLADLRPKIVAEISKKMGKKK